MQQTLFGTKCEAQTLQFGLYTKGPFTPLPASKLSQYGEYVYDKYIHTMH